MTTARRWASTSVPRRATFDRTRAEPAAYLAGLLQQALQHGLPARRTGGPALAWAARRGLPDRRLAAALRRLPGRADPDLDVLLSDLAAVWPELAQRSRRLPSAAPSLTALAVRRSAARTVFVFGDGPLPLLVAKQPTGDGAGVRAETAALTAVDAADVAPRPLGEVSGAVLQEGVPGTPLDVLPVTPQTSAAAGSREAFDGLGAALARLGRTTASPGGPAAALLDPLDTALSADLLSTAARQQLHDARASLAALDVTVLQHGDLSPQNWLVGGAGFAGLVDWETAVPAGVPGFDALHAGVSLLEHGVGLARWSEERVAQSFAAAWPDAPWAAGARSAFRCSALAAGVPEPLLVPLQLAFFGRRLGRRLQRPAGYAVGPAAAARMVETACAS